MGCGCSGQRRISAAQKVGEVTHAQSYSDERLAVCGVGVERPICGMGK